MNEGLELACEISQVGVQRQAASYGLVLNAMKVENVESSEKSDIIPSHHYHIS